MRSSYWLLALLAATACAPASQHAAEVARGQEAGSRLTVGTVQREIRVGMTNAQVIEVLGSPNVVTTDEQRRETWVYDRIATQTVQSGSSGGASLLLLGVGGSAGAVSTSQRTLTIIIRYDGEGRVRDFSYRSSSF
ncbi:outer membrane protein assembly factor BamE [Pseudoroseomonas cervicalis]|uniref:outer membrane protein assembly factor BamE domain-containing protein n=1 Tax=Teichococcus cervicalis TaxID=204525 RepID=UPI00278B59A6|nr:outer membrane protein assembly factor BamE [Pseudoroseomonas cervicalis]MDQ1078617.1 outer membrane protein assembly factor BamE (lipoprotein component of BamABCDE complex) [Pseudoroseomonas cervicalis]